MTPITNDYPADNPFLSQPPVNQSACVDFQNYVQARCEAAQPQLTAAAKLILYPALVYGGATFTNGIVDGGICLRDLVKLIRERITGDGSFEILGSQDVEDTAAKTQPPPSVPLWKRGINSLRNLSKGASILAICCIALEVIGSLAMAANDSGSGGCSKTGLNAYELCGIANDFIVQAIVEAALQIIGDPN